MRFPTSLSLLFLAAFTLVLARPRAARSSLTNGQRLARGMTPKKPARLYNSKRRGALLPRTSGASVPPSPLPMTFTVASSPTNQNNPNAPPPRKRSPAASDGYMSIDSSGNIIYTTDSTQAASFYWSSDGFTLCWIAVQGMGPSNLQIGEAYPVYALELETNWYSLKAGDAADTAGSITNLFGGPSANRYDGDLPAQGLFAQSNAPGFLWFSFSSNDASVTTALVTITNDFSVPYNWYYHNADSEAGNHYAELLMQIIETGDSWSVDEAMTWYDYGVNLVNPVQIYMTDQAEDYSGYLSMHPNNALGLPETDETPVLFFLPMLNDGTGVGPILYIDANLGGVQSIIETPGGDTSGSGQFDLEPFSWSAQGISGTGSRWAGLSYDRQAGRVTWSGYPNTFLETANDLTNNANNHGSVNQLWVSGSSTIDYASVSVCIETVTVGGSPSACALYLGQ